MLLVVLLLDACRFRRSLGGRGAQPAQFRVEHDHAHPHSERMRSGLYQRMNRAVAEFLDVLVLQSFQDFRFLQRQTILGRHGRNIVDQADAQAGFEAQVVENLVQLVGRGRRMLVEFVSFRTFEFILRPDLWSLLRKVFPVLLSGRNRMTACP